MHTRAVVVSVLLGLLVAGCGSHQSPAGHAPVPKGMHRMPDGSLMSGATMSMAPAADPATKPSSAAAMICSPETRDTLTRNLGITTKPKSTTGWANQIYTCTYHLREGTLIASVQDAPTVAAGQHFFTTIRTRTPGLHRITGLQGLGLPGYTDNHGIVLFIKDGKTLQIDATALPAAVGRYRQTPAAVAYGLAADILACWSHH